MIDSKNEAGFLTSAVFFGGLWGLVEATLGYVLHLIPEIFFLPPMSGLILFPIGLYFMIRSMNTTGRPMAIPVTALVAATIKMASGALPFVAFRFVRNPAIAILTEGAVVWAVAGSSAWKISRWLPLKALVLSFGWRLLFLGANIAFGLPGIANKPLDQKIRFVLIDGGIDALIILAAVLLVSQLNLQQEKRQGRSFGPILAFLSVIAGLGGQALFLSL